MTLINPTDDELNRAFAEKVCGWVWTKIREARRINGDLVEPELFVWCRQNGEFAGNPWQHDFTHSADAVLPWLEKDHYSFSIYYDQTTCVWTVELMQRFTGTKTYRASCEESMAKAAVIALLRAHGAEVEFTK